MLPGATASDPPTEESAVKLRAATADEEAPRPFTADCDAMVEELLTRPSPSGSKDAAGAEGLRRTLEQLCAKHQRAVMEQVDLYLAGARPHDREGEQQPRSREATRALSTNSQQPSWRAAIESAGVADLVDEIKTTTSTKADQAAPSEMLGQVPGEVVESTDAAAKDQTGSASVLTYQVPEPAQSSPSVAGAISDGAQSAGDVVSSPKSNVSPKTRARFKDKMKRGNTNVSYESTLQYARQQAELLRVSADRQGGGLVNRLRINLRRGSIPTGKSILHTKSQSVSKQYKWQAKVHALTSHYLYEIFGGLMIALNASVIAWEAQHAAELADSGQGGTTLYFDLLGLFFGFWFTMELALRVFVQGFLPLFFSDERWWNLIDVLVVFGFMLDLVLTVADVASGLNFSLLRVIRLLRVVRVLRVLRSFKNMRDMRIMVSMLCSAVVPLIWISVIMLSVCVTFAIFFTDAVADYVRARHGLDDPVLADLRHYYGDLPKTVATLFMSITGGVDWEGVAQPLSVVSGWCTVGFYVFIAFSSFAMLNVISAIFIDTTIQRSKNDREFVIQTEMEGKRDFQKTMDTLFLELDRDGDGEIHLEELQQHMLLPKVEAYFKSLDLDVSQAKKLFELMDLDHSGTISREEFIVGCSRLRGEARELNVAILQYEVKWIKNLVVNLGLHLDEHFSALNGTLNDSLRTQCTSP